MERRSISALALQLSNVKFQYRASKKRRIEALKGMSFKTPKGALVALLGPNGSGKSTCFKILSTQILADEGQCEILGVPLEKDLSESRKKMGVCFQEASLDLLLTVEENLKLQAALFDFSSLKTAERLKDLTEQLQLKALLKRRTSELSGGQKRRVEIAKALFHEPELLLLDEPTTGLDPQMRKDLWKVLKNLRDEGISVHVSTHLMEEAELCDDVVLIQEGVCIAQGAPRDLKEALGYEIVSCEWDLKNKEFQARVSSWVKEQGWNCTLESNKLRIRSKSAQKDWVFLKEEAQSQLTALEWKKPSLEDLYFEKTGELFESS